MSRMQLAESWAKHLANIAGLPEEKREIIAYAIEILAINLGNLLFTLLVGWILGVLPGTVICLLTVFLFRRTAGGGHSKSPWKCAAVTIIIFPLLARLAKYMAQYSTVFNDIIIVFSLIIGLILIIRLAPVDSPEAPILSDDRRRRLRFFSIMVIVMIILSCLLIRLSTHSAGLYITLCLSLTTLWVSFNLTSIAGKMWNYIDGIR